MKQMVEVDSKGNVELNFHHGQIEAWNAAERFIFVLAGSQAGKTSFGPWWLAREIMEKGGGDYLAVTANFDLFKLKLLPEMLKCFVDILRIGKYHAQLKVLEIRDPASGEFWARDANDEMYARVILRSAKAGSGEVGVRGLESASAKAALLDECGMDDFSPQAWEAVQRRLSLSQGRVLGTTTLYNFGWMRQEIYLPWLQGARDIKVVQFDSIANPAFPLEEFERMRAKLPSWKFNMMYRGVYERPAGQIYNDFDEKRHIIDSFKPPTDSPVVVGVDPGAVNTGVIYLAYVQALGRWVIFDESLDGDLTSQQHAYRARAKTAPWKNSRFYGGAPSEKQFRLDWHVSGVPVIQPPLSDVEAGIDRVIALFKTDKIAVMKHCVGTINQLNEYSRKLDKYGAMTDEIKDKEKYHFLDALRYAVSGLNQPSGFAVVSSKRNW